MTNKDNLIEEKECCEKCEQNKCGFPSGMNDFCHCSCHTPNKLIKRQEEIDEMCKQRDVICSNCQQPFVRQEKGECEHKYKCRQNCPHCIKCNQSLTSEELPQDWEDELKEVFRIAGGKIKQISCLILFIQNILVEEEVKLLNRIHSNAVKEMKNGKIEINDLIGIL